MKSERSGASQGLVRGHIPIPVHSAGTRHKISHRLSRYPQQHTWEGPHPGSVLSGINHFCPLFLMAHPLA